MTIIDQHIIETINQPGKIGVLATADAKGQPNLAYFGSARVLPEGDFVVALGDSRTLTNLEQNQNATYLVLKESPVSFTTQGWRLYLKVRMIHSDGELLGSIRKQIADKVGSEAAKAIKAAILFDVTEIRPLVD